MRGVVRRGRVFRGYYFLVVVGLNLNSYVVLVVRGVVGVLKVGRGKDIVG